MAAPWRRAAGGGKRDGGLDEAVKLIFFGVVPQIDLHQSDSNM